MDSLDPKHWIARAKSDLAWAKDSLDGGHYEGVCFVAQQATEKALKAYLLARGERLRKIHDLMALIAKVIIFDPSIESFKEKAAKLTRYYTETRYPEIGELVTYTQKDAQEALGFAEEMVRFIEEKL